MNHLPADVMNQITSYNFTTYPDNEVIIKFSYDTQSDYSDPTGSFFCDIIIKLDTDIAAYWRNLLLFYVVGELFDYRRAYTTDQERQEINEKLKEVPDYETIFGDVESNGLVTIETDGSDKDKIELSCMFYYEKEIENDYFEGVDFMSDRGLRMRKAAAFLVAHTVVKILKYIIPTPDTKIQDYLTFNEDGDRINQKGEDLSDDGFGNSENDYKLHKKDKCIYSLDFWMKKISYDVKLIPRTDTQDARIVPAEKTNVKFTLVNNKRLPITRGSEGVYMRQLTALLKF